MTVRNNVCTSFLNLQTKVKVTLLEAKNGRLLKSSLAIVHSPFEQFGNLTARVVNATTKSTRLCCTVLHGYKEHGRLAAPEAHITVHTIALFSDFTLSEVEPALIVYGNGGREEKK